jgi:putative oxidoreductase
MGALETSPRATYGGGIMNVKHLLFGNALNCRCADAGLLVLRLAAGLGMAFAHGIKKLPPPQGFIDGVGSLGFPAPSLFAWLAALAEFGGGLLLAVGLLTRPAAFTMAFTMAVAFFMQHGGDPFKVKEPAFLYLAVSLCFLLTGPGRFSVDGLIDREPGDTRGFPVTPR